MGAHKTNPNRIVRAMLPALLPPNYRSGVDISLQVVPKQNVMIWPADKTRATAEGKTEVLVGEPPEWQALPDGMEAHPLGEPLPPEKCDVAAMLGTVVQDTAGPRVLVANGQAPQAKASLMVFCELGRAPLVEWRQRHLGALRGQQDEQTLPSS